MTLLQFCLVFCLSVCFICFQLRTLQWCESVGQSRLTFFYLFIINKSYLLWYFFFSQSSSYLAYIELNQVLHSVLCILCYFGQKNFNTDKRNWNHLWCKAVFPKVRCDDEYSPDETSVKNIHLGSHPTEKFIPTVSITKTLASFGEEGCFNFLTQVYLSTKPLCVVCVCECKCVKHLLLIT